eukprot:TRINITY_DN4522_c0_g2_i3.p2 TRINITY_DN4522_c0_g2~~TRINITY_DN4522_c0_g2_i3.p2  ORF type:complete len:231 (-),score=52.83 TRINITY_DN4522_c0_g2_i3:517-1209(-)
MKSLLEGVKHLHKHNIIHRNIRPQDILLLYCAVFISSDPPNTIQFSNISLAKKLEGTLETFSCGSPGFVAPEVLQKMGYNLKADLYSCGVLMYMLLTGISPFVAPKVESIIEKNQLGEVQYPKDIQKIVSREALDLVESLLQADQYKRPSASECLNHPWFIKEGRENLLEFALKNIQSYVQEEAKMPDNQPKSSSNLLTIGSLVSSKSMVMDEEESKPKGYGDVCALCKL